MKGMGALFVVLLIGMAVAFLWDSVPVIKTTVHAALDPTFGVLLDMHATFGFLIIIIVFTFITTMFQKYMTDQKQLKELKEEQKLLQIQMKQYREHPEKMMELNNKSMEIVMKTMPLTMRPAMYTSVPFILFFRWFGDYFTLHPMKIFAMNWILAYILFSIIFSSILRKMLKVF